MSVPTTIQAKLIPFTISRDSGVTYKNVVCLKAWNFSGDTTTTEEETQCGTFTGLAANKSGFDFELLVNTSPDGATELSAAEILDIWNDQEQIYAKTAPAAGLTISGPGYLTNITLGATVGSLISMTGTFSLDGDPTIA